MIELILVGGAIVAAACKAASGFASNARTEQEHRDLDKRCADFVGDGVYYNEYNRKKYGGKAPR